jgi:hypothetical protein
MKHAQKSYKMAKILHESGGNMAETHCNTYGA